MRHLYETPEMEITIFSLNTSVLAASNKVTETTVSDEEGNQGDGNFDPFG